MATTTASPHDLVSAIPPRMVQLWAAHDADAFGDLFWEDGIMLLPGTMQEGRESIRDFMQAAYVGPYAGTRVTGTPVAVRPLGPTTVALVTEGGVIPAGEDELPESAAIRATWLFTERDGEWRLSLYQNCVKTVPAAA